MIPVADDRLLPDIAASHAENVWLQSGAARGLPTPKLLHEAAAGTNKVFRLPANYADSSYLFDSAWIEFQDASTDVIRSPVFGDDYDRYYWASSAAAPRYNTRTRIENEDPAWLLGVPAPATPPDVSVDGGSGTDVTRSYVVTWVSEYGEEGPPSPPTVHLGKVDGTWEIGLPEPDANDLGVNRFLTKARIYRTVVSDAGVATFFLVAERDIEESSDYEDTATDAAVASNEQLQSTNWSPPPSDLRGFAMMPNGIVAAWRDNEVWFCEPYRPHAWPAQYAINVEYPIVGLGVVGQTLVICTQSAPFTASGVNPAFITTSRFATIEPCVSRGSIMSTPEGVYYASLNGLVLVNPGRVENVTKNLASKERWQQLTRGSALRAARLGTAYFAFGSIRPGVFDEDAFDEDAFAQEDGSGARSGILIDPSDQRVALTVLSSEDLTSSVFNDAWSGEVFILRENNVYWVDLADPQGVREAFQWKSKIFQTAVKGNMGVMCAYFDPGNLTSDLGEVRVYADGRHVVTRQLEQSGKIMKLPAGFKAEFWQFDIRARVQLFSLHVASTAKELRRI
jgi:hypothetical protein